MISPQDERALLGWNDKGPNKIDLTLLFTDGNTRSESLREFCDILTALLPEFVIHEQKADSEQVPAIRVGDRLRYMAVPLGQELAPFMETALMPEKLSQSVNKPVQKLATELELPTQLKLYISPQCPYCPDAVRKLSPLPLACEWIHLTIIDGTMFPEMAEVDGIKSAPTVVLDEFRWMGTIRLDEIVHMILSRDPSELSSSTIRNLIGEGAASQVAQLMIEHQIIFPGLIDLLTDMKWPVRLGAMVAVEEVAEKDPILASQVIVPLWHRFNMLEDAVKGDALYLMGETGTADTLPLLKRLSIESPGEEIKTIAQEAMESIRARLK